MYNEIEGNYDDVAINTFKRGLPTEHGLRKSLTGKPVTSLCQLMDRIDKYKRVEEDHQVGKGKAKVVPQERKDFRSDRFRSNNRSRRDYTEQLGSAAGSPRSVPGSITSDLGESQEQAFLQMAK